MIRESMETFDFVGTLKFRPNLYNYSKLRLTAHNVSISDSLLSMTQDEAIAPFLPEGMQKINYMTLYIEYYYDSRNSSYLPPERILFEGLCGIKMVWASSDMMWTISIMGWICIFTRCSTIAGMLLKCLSF